VKKKVNKTTFEVEQKNKEDVFLKLTPLQRLALMAKHRRKMRKPGINYSYRGMTVTVKRGR